MAVSSPIAVIAVSYFNSTELERLILSLRKQNFEAWSLMIVDNSLDDIEREKVELLAATDPRIQVTAPSANLGYLPSALNALSLVQDSEWTLVCNSDLEFSDPNAFSRISQIKSEKIAVVAPRVVDQQSGVNLNPFLKRAPSRLWLYSRLIGTSSSATFTIMTKFNHWRLRSAKFSATTGDESPKKIFAAHGSCFVMSSFFARTLVGNQFQFLYGEELTLAQAAREVGMSIVYDPRVAVIHHSHASTSALRRSFIRKLQSSALETYLRVRNR